MRNRLTENISKGESRQGANSNGRTLPMRILNKADYWRTRAKETRVIAELMQNDESRKSLLLSANEYERMAQVAESDVREGERHKKTFPFTELSIPINSLSIFSLTSLPSNPIAFPMPASFLLSDF